ncbi:MAG: helix-turn-helix transcriptional regulator [Burkholderiaceae bacterium]|nr:helix-turn-helix transcriptional regulator [Burkholderiaceae bacterium]
MTAASEIEHSVFQTLRATNATLERFALLGDNLALALWSRETTEEETGYAKPGHHTLSYYLGGGYRTEREDLPGFYGAPDRLCTLPDDHESTWVVRDNLRFLHLYFLPEHFTRRAVHELNREPRELTLADRTYFEHEAISRLCFALAHQSWEGPDASLRANEQSHAALSLLLRAQGVARRAESWRGGLAPVVRQRLADYIEANLAEPLTLGSLAALVSLSEYHLARMFHISFGMAPYAWIAARRIDRARALLGGTGLPLQQVAAQCGYADASHFSHRFRAAVGATPAQYRKVIRT